MYEPRFFRKRLVVCGLTPSCAETFGRVTETFGGEQNQDKARSGCPAPLEDARHTLVADLEALRPERVSNSPQRPLLSP
jgi:hypothetical protein